MKQEISLSEEHDSLPLAQHAAFLRDDSARHLNSDPPTERKPLPPPLRQSIKKKTAAVPDPFLLPAPKKKKAQRPPSLIIESQHHKEGGIPQTATESPNIVTPMVHPDPVPPMKKRRSGKVPVEAKELPVEYPPPPAEVVNKKSNTIKTCDVREPQKSQPVQPKNLILPSPPCPKPLYMSCKSCGMDSPFCCRTGMPHNTIPPCAVCGLSTPYCPKSGRPHHNGLVLGDVPQPVVAVVPNMKKCSTATSTVSLVHIALEDEEINESNTNAVPPAVPSLSCNKMKKSSVKSLNDSDNVVDADGARKSVKVPRQRKNQEEGCEEDKPRTVQQEPSLLFHQTRELFPAELITTPQPTRQKAKTTTKGNITKITPQRNHVPVTVKCSRCNRTIPKLRALLLLKGLSGTASSANSSSEAILTTTNNNALLPHSDGNHTTTPVNEDLALEGVDGVECKKCHRFYHRTCFLSDCGLPNNEIRLWMPCQCCLSGALPPPIKALLTFTVEHWGEELLTKGYVVVPLYIEPFEKIMACAKLDDLRKLTMKYYDALRAQYEVEMESGRLVPSLEHGYSNFRQRCPGRFELVADFFEEHLQEILPTSDVGAVLEYAMSHGNPATETIVAGGKSTTPLLKRCCFETEIKKKEVRNLQTQIGAITHCTKRPPSVISSGCFLSERDSQDQNWHTDGPTLSSLVHLRPYAVNVFVPLVNVDHNNGTEVKPFTHQLLLPSNDDKPPATTDHPSCASLTPLVAVGEALLFDYRLLHRGVANKTGAPRACVYITYAQSWYKDTYNYGQKRYKHHLPVPSNWAESRSDRYKRQYEQESSSSSGDVTPKLSQPL